MKPLYIPCECRTPYHCLVIDEDEDVPDELIVSFVATRPGSLWHRIRYAMKHIFQRQDLVFADIMIKRHDLLEALEDEKA